MKEQHVFQKSIFMLIIIAFAFVSCSDEESVGTEEQNFDITEMKLASEVDIVGETISDIIIDSYEIQENSEFYRTENNQTNLPDCVSITILIEQGFREVTLDFGSVGCMINGHMLRGQIVFSYTRNLEALEVLINYTLVDFYFDTKQVLGSRTILRELSNDNGNPQFTHSLDLTVIWPNGAQASREGLIIKEWIEGFGSGVFSDNVFEVTGNWTTTFLNGNMHSYEVLVPLRSEVVCPYFVSGSIDVQRTNFGGTFDYGSGNCDNQAIFTTNNGDAIDVTLN